MAKKNKTKAKRSAAQRARVAPRPSFPKTLYARIESESSDPGSYWWIADDTPHGEHGERVAVYQLVDIKTMTVTSELK